LPGPVARRAHKSTLKASVEDLKREAERRAASSATARAEQPSTPASADDSDREARLAEQVGIKRPERRTTAPPAPQATEDWGSDGSHSVAELPGLLVGEAASVGRRVARRGMRTAQGMGEGAAGAGLDAARRAVRAGREVADAMIKPWTR
jgi:hypothetical protein